MYDTFVYEHGGSLYINLTNNCTNSCDFCIRNIVDGIDGYNLWLEREPDTDDILNALKKYNMTEYDQVVFCGYGEPTIRLDVLLDTANKIKDEYIDTIIRINTNGQSNLYHNKDITPMLEGSIDKLSISLNAPDSKEYQRICHSRFGEAAFEGVLEFARLSKNHVPSVSLTVVDVIGEDKIQKCRELADKNALPLYMRHAL